MTRPLPDLGLRALAVAPLLLGCVLRVDDVALRLTEVEAYEGADDPASHAFAGLTTRNAPMFGPAGRFYVYFSYGMHHAVNLVCGPEGTASAVLLRAGEVVAGLGTARSRRPGVADVRLARGPGNKLEELRIELYEKVNALGIGAQGLGGLTTVLDVKIALYPTHAAGKPVAMIPNCAATRHAHVVMDGSGPVYLDPPSLDLWPDVQWAPDYDKSRKVDLNTLTPAEVASWKPGQTLLLNGKMLTGRDAAHKRIQDMLAKGEKLPVDFTNRVIYYVGPVDPVRDEVVGPAGPTTATRMDKFTEMMLAQTGLIGMIGKAERGPAAIEAIKKHKSAYLMAVGGAAYLVAKAIKQAKVVGFADLGMEAIYEFDVQDMPVTVAVDSHGSSVHDTGPKEWQAKIGKIPVVTA